MRRKGRKAALVSVAIAGILVLALLAAGTLLRMHSRDMGLAEAFVSFVRDTFNAGG